MEKNQREILWKNGLTNDATKLAVFNYAESFLSHGRHLDTNNETAVK